MIDSSDSWLRLRHWRAVACAALAMVLSACASPYYQPGPRAQIGAFTGAAAGGLLGSAASGGAGDAIVAGVLLGGLLGGAVGDSLDRADRIYAARSVQQGLEYQPSGRTSYWHNPDNGHAGSVTPTGTYETDYGHCREFTQTVTIEGNMRRARGTACRDWDGRWRVDR
jgi:surface antigen